MCEAGGEGERWWSKHWAGSELQQLFLAGLFLICQQVVSRGFVPAPGSSPSPVLVPQGLVLVWLPQGFGVSVQAGAAHESLTTLFLLWSHFTSAQCWHHLGLLVPPGTWRLQDRCEEQPQAGVRLQKVPNWGLALPFSDLEPLIPVLRRGC